MASKIKKFTNRGHELLRTALMADDVAALRRLLDSGLIQPEPLIYQDQNALMLAMSADANHCSELLSSEFRVESASANVLARTIALSRFHGRKKIEQHLTLLVANAKTSSSAPSHVSPGNGSAFGERQDSNRSTFAPLARANHELGQLRQALDLDDVVALEALLATHENFKSDILELGGTSLSMAMNAQAPACITILLKHIDAMPDDARSTTLSTAMAVQNFVVFERLVRLERERLINEKSDLAKQLARMENAMLSLTAMVSTIAKSVDRIEGAMPAGPTRHAKQESEDKLAKPLEAELLAHQTLRAAIEEQEATEKIQQRERESNYEDFRATLRKLKEQEATEKSKQRERASNFEDFRATLRKLSPSGHPEKTFEPEAASLETLGIKASEARERLAEASSPSSEKPKLRAERQP